MLIRLIGDKKKSWFDSFGQHSFNTHTSIQQDPDLQNLESRFALQQKIVEAAKKLASEPELYKTVRKTRKQNCYDAVKRLQEIENAINEYRIKSGKKPTQRASLILQGNTSWILW